MKTTLHLTLYLTLLVSSLCSLSCSDDKEAMPRLFRPSFIASSCVADGNSISLAWRTSGEPTSYTAELSEDSTFATSATLSQTVEGGKCTFDNLKYETAYYVRVRANNEAMQLVSNWTVYESTVSTLSRIVPKLLYPVDERNITDGSVLLQWTGAGETNPVDGLCVWTEEEMEAGTEGSAVSLSATDVAAGSYRLSGLSPRTVYYVALTNSQAPEGAEDYNVRRFRTGGMPAGAVSVTDGADLYARIKAGMEDASLSELVFCLQNGVDYYLNEEGAADGKTGTIALTKSIALLAEPGEHPTLYVREGGFQVGTDPHIDYFTVENVDVEENVPDNSRGSKTYLFGVGKRSAGNDCTIDRFELVNSAVMLPTGVIMMNEANDGVTTINHIRIDNCRVTGINDTKLVTKQFGFIHAPKKGGNVWNDVRVTNSTFYEFYISPGVIRLLSPLRFASDLTVAGHTAPGDGIVIYGNNVSFYGADNLICRYLRIRMGENGPRGKDAAGIAYGENMIFDHLSVTWGRDECFSINGSSARKEGAPRNITIQNSFIGQGLQPHSCGGLMQTDADRGITLYRNLYIDNKTRNPKVKGVNQFVNNVVYNWGNGGAYIMGGRTQQTCDADIRNNYFIAGPTLNYDGKTLGFTAPFSRYNENFRVYMEGNLLDDNLNGRLDGRGLTHGECVERVKKDGVETVYRPTFLDRPSAIHPTIEGLQTADEAYTWIVAHGGASLPQRDQVDTYLVEELQSLGRKGTILSSERELPTGGVGELRGGTLPRDTDGDGMPDAFEDRYGLDKEDASDAMQLASNGYTNLENYLFLLEQGKATD